MKHPLKYYFAAFIFFFVFSDFSFAQQKTPSETSQQAQSELKHEKKREKSRKKREEKAGNESSTISTEPQHKWLTKRKREKSKSEVKH